MMSVWNGGSLLHYSFPVVRLVYQRNANLIDVWVRQPNHNVGFQRHWELPASRELFNLLRKKEFCLVRKLIGINFVKHDQEEAYDNSSIQPANKLP
jgi:hypothetical protein